MRTVYPCVPGYEIVGRVTKAGSTVRKVKPRDLSAVGCMWTRTGQVGREVSLLDRQGGTQIWVRDE
jgi:D-arabinose 1-dehydrogenase-like Zn-dependent alcohol dehydrogenase